MSWTIDSIHFPHDVSWGRSRGEIEARSVASAIPADAEAVLRELIEKTAGQGAVVADKSGSPESWSA